MTKEGSTKIIIFMTPEARVLELGRDHISNIMKIDNFFKKPPSILPGKEQTNYV